MLSSNVVPTPQQHDDNNAIILLACPPPLIFHLPVSFNISAGVLCVFVSFGIPPSKEPPYQQSGLCPSTRPRHHPFPNADAMQDK